MKFEERTSKLRIKKHQGRETPEFLADVVKMAQGEPFEYIMGEVLFCDAKVDLSLQPMIPRPETEFWVKEAITQMSREKPQVLDLFAGSGCVGLALLKDIPESNVTFVEIDKKSKEQIEMSLEKNKIDKNRAKIVIEDCVKFLQNASGQKFDTIFAVPPYVPSQMKEEVMKELKAEDELYFFDKEDGLFYIKKVLELAPKLLNKDGSLFMEFDITQREKIEELVKENNLQNYSFLKDPYGHECCVVLKLLDK